MTLPVPLFYLHNGLFVNLWWPPRYNWNIVESGGNTANLTLNTNQSIEIHIDSFNLLTFVEIPVAIMNLAIMSHRNTVVV